MTRSRHYERSEAIQRLFFWIASFLAMTLDMRLLHFFVIGSDSEAIQKDFTLNR